MAELVIHLLKRVTHSLVHDPLQYLDHAAAAAAAQIPHPMIPHNHASLRDQCFIGPAFKSMSVVNAKGWEWVNESKTAHPKWGYISKQPGSRLVFKVNATASSGNTTAPVLVQVGYLSSYQHMGKAQLE
jgi:DNA polymerase alpha subunit B